MQGLMIWFRYISMTFSICLMYIIWCIGTINFLDSKAISKLKRNCNPAVGYSKKSKVLVLKTLYTRQINRVGCTDHKHTIKLCIGCSSEQVIKKFTLK